MIALVGESAFLRKNNLVKKYYSYFKYDEGLF